MSEKRICSTCRFWQMGIPVGHCVHEKARFLPTSDRMVWDDAGPDCPFNKFNIRGELISNPSIIIDKMADFCRDTGVTGAVIGISGGKDSTIVAKLMCEILGKENVFGVLMPNGVQKDISDSQRVVKMLDIPYITVNIESAFKGLMNEMDTGLTKAIPDSCVSMDAIINLPPRIRMTTLYAVAQSLGRGWRVVGTTNKSEDYIGWLTKWGDGGCDIEPIIDFTVTELWQLGLNLGLPKDLVCKTPIDGLASGSDEDRFGFTYTQLDMFIETGTCGDKVIDDKIKKMHMYSEHKRNLIPAFRLI